MAAARCEVGLNTPECEIVCWTICFSCGKPACKSCSKKTWKYYHWKIKRICFDCIEDRTEDIRDERIILQFPRKQ